MLNFGSGHSKAVNTRKAVAESLESAGIGPEHSPKLVVVHTTLGHDLPQMLSSLREGAPGTQIVGCTGSGVIGSGWVSEAVRAMALVTVDGEGITVASVAGVSGENSRSKALACAEELRVQAPDANMLMLLGPGLNVDADALIAGVEAVFGPDVPIFGGLAGFGGTIPRTPVFHDDRILDDGLVLIGFTAPDLELVQMEHHGSLPRPDRFTITAAEGQRLDELDGKPAWPTLMASIDMPATTPPMEVITLIGLGLDLSDDDQREYDNAKILRVPLALAENGTSCYLQYSLPEGTVVTSCQRDEHYLFEGATRLMERLKARLKGRQPLAIFQTDCLARGRLSHNVVEKDGIIRDMQQSLSAELAIPWVGVYGFAEFGVLNGRNRSHNYTTTLSAVVTTG